MNYINIFLDFFLPRICPSCNQRLDPSERFICKECTGSLKYTGSKRIESEFERKFKDEKLISGFLPLFVFEKDKELQQIIHSIKYNENFRLGIHLGKLIGEELKDHIEKWDADYFIPVPLHHLKKADRGYNQSYYLSKGISTITGIPVNRKTVKRKRYTVSQTSLNLSERKSNMENAFSIRKNSNISGKKIVLVDDVITTGATISECARILKDNGADKIYALSAAVADF